MRPRWNAWLATGVAAFFVAEMIGCGAVVGVLAGRRLVEVVQELLQAL